jgi:hypothetical protein
MPSCFFQPINIGRPRSLLRHDYGQRRKTPQPPKEAPTA